MLHASLGIAGIASMIAGRAADLQIVTVMGGNLLVLVIVATVHWLMSDRGRELMTLRGFRRGLFLIVGLCGFMVLVSGLEGIAASAILISCYAGIGVLTFGREVVSRPQPEPRL
jgi:Ca2+/Na+ antiporter